MSPCLVSLETSETRRVVDVAGLGSSHGWQLGGVMAQLAGTDGGGR